MSSHQVLLIEDEAELLELIALQIDEPRIEVISCDNSIKAFNILKKQNIPLVVTDLTMPQMSGLELIKKCQECLDPIPTFYLMTGYLDRTEKEMAQFGVEKLFYKPEDMTKMVAEIKRFFD